MRASQTLCTRQRFRSSRRNAVEEQSAPWLPVTRTSKHATRRATARAHPARARVSPTGTDRDAHPDRISSTFCWFGGTLISSIRRKTAKAGTLHGTGLVVSLDSVRIANERPASAPPGPATTGPPGMTQKPPPRHGREWQETSSVNVRQNYQGILYCRPPE